MARCARCVGRGGAAREASSVAFVVLSGTSGLVGLAGLIEGTGGSVRKLRHCAEPWLGCPKAREGTRHGAREVSSAGSRCAERHARGLGVLSGSRTGVTARTAAPTRGAGAVQAGLVSSCFQVPAAAHPARFHSRAGRHKGVERLRACLPSARLLRRARPHFPDTLFTTGPPARLGRSGSPSPAPPQLCLGRCVGSVASS